MAVMTIQSIVHPTDFTDLSGLAFCHALRIAVAAKSKLHLLHVSPHATVGALAFPQARRLLAQWGLSQEDDPPWVVANRLGIEVDATRVNGQEPTKGILEFFRTLPCDLTVLATHAKEGMDHWLNGSVAEIVSRHSAVPALFIAPGARGFVSQITGEIRLRRALVPIDFSPKPEKAIKTVQQIGKLLTGADITVHLLHIGNSAPPLSRTSFKSPMLPPVMLRSGNIVKSIIDMAIEFDVDFIGMPTAGHRNVLDALRGSTTERVIRHAPCPLIAVPAA